jgi:hypothetical protein
VEAKHQTKEEESEAEAKTGERNIMRRKRKLAFH